MTEIKNKIRQVTEEDKALPYLSYSKMDNFDKCPYKHKLKYEDKNFSKISTLPMEIGSILHKSLELKGLMKIEEKEVDYEYLKEIVINGCVEEDAKSDKRILGINDLKKKYFEEYFSTDAKSGMNYEEKMEIFYNKVLPTRIEDKEWHPIAVEKQFEFVYDNKVVIHGFIDRIDKNSNGDLRITDYKSSKAVFRDADIKTPMQHVIYDLACLYLYDKLPIDHVYDFILIDAIQSSEDGVCSKGYFNRGIKKLDKIINEMSDMKEKSLYPPKPTPLCYWCTYHSNSPNADPLFAGLCQYHSLWTPENKNFKVLNRYDENEVVTPKTTRKLVF